MENLNVKIESLNGNVLTVLQGHALELKQPEKLSIVGDIKSISSFLSVRKKTGAGFQVIDPATAIVKVDKKALSIQLLLDPNNFFSTTITAKLEKSDEVAPFFINQNKTFTKEELVKLIKFNKLYFDNADKHAEMLLAFQKVSSTVNISSKEGGDDRGNKERDFVKSVVTNAPTEFVLNIPIFKGFPAVRFRVEVCLDVTEGSARFWFESVELHEIVQRQVDEIFSEELKSCEGLVVINI